MVPRISVVAKISIRKKPLAISGMISEDDRHQPGRGLVEFRPRARGRSLAPSRAGWLNRTRAPWVDATCQRLASRPCGRTRQHQHHDEEGHHDGVGRDVDRAELLGEADDQCAERGARDRAHAADDDDHERGEQEADVLAGRKRLEGAADDAGDAGKARAEREHQHEDELDRARRSRRACRGRRRRRGPSCRSGCG